jgi:hypothetical protein
VLERLSAPRIVSIKFDVLGSLGISSVKFDLLLVQSSMNGLMGKLGLRFYQGV